MCEDFECPDAILTDGHWTCPLCGDDWKASEADIKADEEAHLAKYKHILSVVPIR